MCLLRAESNLIIEYLQEYEIIFETALTHESGDPGVFFVEKTEGQKSR
jgi:D-serine dehydratase